MNPLDFELQDEGDAALHHLHGVVPHCDRDDNLYLAAEVKRALSQVYKDIEADRWWPDRLDG